MVLPQESGQLPVSRLGDAIRSAGVNPTASEVENYVQLRFWILRMEKHDLLIPFGKEKVKDISHLWNLNLLKSWKVSQMLPATEAGLTLERFQQLMQVRIEGYNATDGVSHWQIPGQVGVLIGDSMNAIYEDGQIKAGRDILLIRLASKPSSQGARPSRQ